MTVSGFANEWLVSIRSAIKFKTWESYEGLLRVHVVPRVGSIQLAKLEPSHLTKLYADLMGNGLSPETTGNVHRVVHGMLGKAFRWGVVARNVAALVSPPRVRVREKVMLTPEQVRAFLRTAEGHRLETLFTLAITTGARSGELLGLTWECVDLDQGFVHIRKALQQTEDGLSLAEPKTARSRRSVAIPQIAVVSLRGHRARQAEEALRLGSAWRNDYGLVFTTEIGTPLDARNVLKRQLRPLLAMAGLPSALRFHDLRHIAISLALAQGMPVPAVSEMVGHADAAITLRVYAHAIPGGQRQVADALESVLVG